MAEVTKYQLVSSNGNLFSDMKSQFSLFKTKKKSLIVFTYGFMFAFVLFTLILALNPLNSSSPWFFNIFSSSTTTDSSSDSTINDNNTPTSSSSSYFSDESYRSSIFSYFSPPRSHHNFSSPFGSTNYPPPPPTEYGEDTTLPRFNDQLPIEEKNKTNSEVLQPTTINLNQTVELSPSVTGSAVAASGTEAKTNASVEKDGTFKSNHTALHPRTSPQPAAATEKEGGVDNNYKMAAATALNSTENEGDKNNKTAANPTAEKEENKKAIAAANSTATSSFSEKTGTVLAKQGKYNNLIDKLVNCDLYDGGWVRDDSYPLYKPGSCSLIDEQFNCPSNGRPDRNYMKLKWQPKACTIPRLNGRRMLKLLRGKRLVFVGDSLNRNMWEALVCLLRNAVKDKSKVYEAYGRQNYRTEASYSFVFQDYNCTIEFFASPFLVRQWEVKDKNGEKKETLRLDLIAESANQFKGADIYIFNTGHWWTHEKTSKGQDYYQEGSHVYSELDVDEAFRRAITTWGMWIDANVNSSKTHVLYRGYSASHFSGGQWNSGGACDSETEPIKNETYLTPYPLKMKVFEKVIKGMKTPVSYLNVTKLTDFRKDGHPSIYRKQKLSDEEKKSPLRYQDCSHWCLPGVPDSWNELLYAEILRKQYKDQQQRKRR